MALNYSAFEDNKKRTSESNKRKTSEDNKKRTSKDLDFSVFGVESEKTQKSEEQNKETLSREQKLEWARSQMGLDKTQERQSEFDEEENRFTSAPLKFTEEEVEESKTPDQSMDIFTGAPLTTPATMEDEAKGDVWQTTGEGLQEAKREAGARRKDMEFEVGRGLSQKQSQKATDVLSKKPAWEQEWEKRQQEIQKEAEQLPKGYKEPGIIGQIGDSIKQATVSNLSALGSSLESLGHEVGQRGMVERGQEISDYFQKQLVKNPEWQEPKTEKFKNSPSRYARLVAGAVPSIGGTLISSAVGGVLGGPVGAGTAGFGFAKQLEGGSAYQEARNAGAKPEEAERIASSVGNINGILEFLPVGRLLKKTPGGEELAQNVFKRTAKEMGKQGASEASTEGTQEIIANAFLREVDENRELFEGVLDSLIAGGGAGALFGGGASIVTAPEVQQAVESQEGFSKLPGRQEQDSFYQEARKYNNAEEFIQANKKSLEESQLRRIWEETNSPQKRLPGEQGIIGESFFATQPQRKGMKPETRAKRAQGIKSEAQKARENIIQKYKAKEENAKEIKKELVDYAKKHLDLNEKGKLLNRVKNAKTKADLTKDVAYIEKLADEKQGRIYTNRIKKTVKKTKAVKGGQKPKGKYTPEVQATLDRVRELVNTSQKQAQEKLEQNLKEYADKQPPPEIAQENAILEMFTGTTDQKRQLLDTINKLIDRGEKDAFLQKFNIQEDLDRKRKFVIDKVTGGEGIEKGRLRGEPVDKTTIQQVKQYLKGIGKNTILTWRGLMTALDFNSSVESRSLADVFSVVKNENKYKELQSQHIEKFNDAISRIYNITNKPNSILKKTRQLSQEKITIDGREMTRDEVIKRYMEIQDPTLRDSFIYGNGYTDKTFRDINNALTREDKNFARWQLRYYQDLYSQINEVYSKLYGVNLPFNEFYSPIKRAGVKQEPGKTEFLEEAFYRKAVTNKSLFSRQANLNPIAKQSSLQTLDRHVNEMNYFIAWSEKIRELDSIFTDPKVRDAIKQEFPNSVLKAIDRKLQDMAQNGNQNALTVSWVDSLRKNYTLGTLAVKPALSVKQLVSTVAYMEKMGPVDMAKGVADFAKNPIENFNTLKKESAFIRMRGENMERDIKAAMKEGVFDRYNKKQNLLNQLMINVKLGDKTAIVLGSWALRRKRLKEGWDIQDIVNEYEEFSSETQQSSDVSRLSNVQLGDSFSRLFTMFMSSPRAYLQKEVNAVKSLFRKDGFSKKNRRKVAKTLFIYHVALPVFFQWVSNLGGWDEEDRKEYLRAGILGSINGLYIAGDIVDSVLRQALGLRVWDTEVPIADIADDINKTMRNLSFDDMTEEDLYTALDGLSGAATSISGLPIEYAYDALESLYRANYEKGIKQLMGWSEYYIDTEKESEEKEETSRKPKVKTDRLKNMNIKVNTNKLQGAGNIKVNMNKLK